MANKNPKRKARLMKKTRQNKALPMFVLIRTNRKVRYNNKTRNWRTQKIKRKEKD